MVQLENGATTATLAVTTMVRVPMAVIAVVKFGVEGDKQGDVSAAFADDGDPFDYDLEPGECFVRYVLDQSYTPQTRRVGDPLAAAFP